MLAQARRTRRTGARRPPKVTVAQASQTGMALPPAGEQERPVRTRPDYHLNTGLAVYAMWVQMFEGAPDQPSESEPFRRGRIWA
jgi:cyanobactin cluster PatC/TenC/TruC protein